MIKFIISISINIIVGIKRLLLTQVNARVRRADVTGHHTLFVLSLLFLCTIITIITISH